MPVCSKHLANVGYRYLSSINKILMMGQRYSGILRKMTLELQPEKWGLHHPESQGGRTLQTDGARMRPLRWQQPTVVERQGDGQCGWRVVSRVESCKPWWGIWIFCETQWEVLRDLRRGMTWINLLEEDFRKVRMEAKKNPLDGFYSHLSKRLWWSEPAFSRGDREKRADLRMSSLNEWPLGCPSGSHGKLRFILTRSLWNLHYFNPLDRIQTIIPKDGSNLSHFV